jgi:hypothetical protein
MSQRGRGNWDHLRVDRTARHAAERAAADAAQKAGRAAQEAARVRRYEQPLREDLARVFARWARRYHIPTDEGLLIPKWLIHSEYYPVSATEMSRYPRKLYISRWGKLSGAYVSLAELERYVGEKIARYDYPWP